MAARSAAALARALQEAASALHIPVLWLWFRFLRTGLVQKIMPQFCRSLCRPCCRGNHLWP